MRKIALARFAFAIFFAVPLVAQQQPAPSSPKPDAQIEGLAAPSSMTGTLSKVDATANMLTIKKADDKEQSFTLDPAAKITLDGKAATVSQLKAGQKVSVTVDGNKATSVSATSASSSS